MTTFDPSDWLNRWEAIGGGWHVQNGEPKLCHVEGAPIGTVMPELHYRGRMDAVEAAILERHAAKEMQQPGTD